MRIVLVRHGKPIGIDVRPISGRDFGRWVRHYDDSGITRDLVPPATVCAAAAVAGCVLVSDRVRARESVAQLVAAERITVEPELREAALPESLPFATRLSPGAWVVLARVAWWLDDYPVGSARYFMRKVLSASG